MARDYTKYNLEGLGENLNKRQLVYTIVKDFIEKNNPTLESLLTTFPDELQGSKGVVRKESDVDDPKRFNMKDPLKIKNGMHVVVSNQWGDNLPGFIDVAKKMGYSIFKSEYQNDNSDTFCLKLPDNLILNNYSSEWGRYIVLSYENSSDCDSEFSKIQLDTTSNCIVPFNLDSEDLTLKWFDSYEAILSSDNKQNYSGIMGITFKNTIERFVSCDLEWSIIWHDKFEDLNDGQFPIGISSDKINNIFSNEWFSQVFDFVNLNKNLDYSINFEENYNYADDSEDNLTIKSNDNDIVKQDFYPNGNLERRETFKDGIETWEQYYENGNLKKVSNYKDDKWHGLQETYYENGIIEYRGSFKNDEHDGVSEMYHNNGQLAKKMPYSDGQENGIWEYYDENGHLDYIESYKNGKYHGVNEYYDDNGNLRDKSVWEDGKMISSGL
jgi:antitoxin component YwqK of YwqJK toxin-antitoxin module